MKTAATLFALFAFAPACVTQQPGKTPPKDPFVVEAGELALDKLIDRCAAYLDCNILLNPQEMSATVPGSLQLRLQKAISTDAAGCEEFLAGILYRFGLAMTQVSVQGPTFEVIAMHGPRGREVSNRAVQRTPEQVLARPDLKVMVLTFVQLKHINATIATNALRPFFASAGVAGPASTLTLGTVGNNTAILLLGMQDQVAQAIRLLQACDLPPPADEVERARAGGERLEALERRLRALEEKLAAAEKAK